MIFNKDKTKEGKMLFKITESFMFGTKKFLKAIIPTQSDRNSHPYSWGKMVLEIAMLAEIRHMLLYGRPITQNSLYMKKYNDNWYTEALVDSMNSSDKEDNTVFLDHFSESDFESIYHATNYTEEIANIPYYFIDNDILRNENIIPIHVFLKMYHVPEDIVEMHYDRYMIKTI